MLLCYEKTDLYVYIFNVFIVIHIQFDSCDVFLISYLEDVIQCPNNFEVRMV
jgi:hypothetical protein